MSRGAFSDQPITRGLIAGFRFAALKEELTDARHRRKIREENLLINQRQAAQREELNAAALKAARRKALSDRFDIAERLGEASARSEEAGKKKSTEPQKQGPPLPDAVVEPGGIDPVAIAGLIREELGPGKSSASFGMATLIADAAIKTKETELQKELLAEQHANATRATEMIASAVDIRERGLSEVYIQDASRNDPIRRLLEFMGERGTEVERTFSEDLAERRVDLTKRGLDLEESRLKISEAKATAGGLSPEKRATLIRQQTDLRKQLDDDNIKDPFKLIKARRTLRQINFNLGELNAVAPTDAGLLSDIQNLPEISEARQKIIDLETDKSLLGRVAQGLTGRKSRSKETQTKIDEATRDFTELRGRVLKKVGASKRLIDENEKFLKGLSAKTVKIDGLDIVPTNDPATAAKRAVEALSGGTKEEQLELAQKILEASSKK